MYSYLLQPPFNPDDLEQQAISIENNQNAFYARFNELFTETQNLMHRNAPLQKTETEYHNEREIANLMTSVNLGRNTY